MNIDLVIFDCDGVLVDSEPLINGVFVELASELGAPDLSEGLARLTGASLDVIFPYIAEHTQQPLPDDFEAQYRQRSAVAFRERLKAVPGIEAVVTNLPYPICVASNGPVSKMTLNLTVTGLLPFFEGKLFSSYDVQRWKPEPDVYLHAARTMGFSPANCVVIEDTPVGVQAAKAAGMTVLSYAGRTPAELLTQAGAKVFTNMGDVLNLLAQLEANNA